MNRWFPALFLLIYSSVSAQYYYKDIITLKQSAEEQSAFQKAGIRKIKIESFEKDDNPAEGFRCEKKMAKDYLSSSLQTKLAEIGYSILKCFYNQQLQVVKVIDSSELSATHVLYTYHPSGKLLRCESHNRSADDDFINEHLEEHLYTYDTSGIPTEMQLIKNKTDTALILFSRDESGKIGLEKDTKTGRKYYYYYDNEGRLTDIAHSSDFRSELIPDYLFDYYDNGTLAKMTGFENSGKGKTSIRYEYEDGLKKTELIYINGQYTGKIVYEYSK